MPHRSPASSLPEWLVCAVLLTACGDDSDATSTAASTDATTGAPASTTTTEPGTTTAEPGTTTAEPGTTTAATSDPTTTTTDATTGAGVCGDNTLTWDNFGQAFLLSWCTGCHNSQLPTAQRAGAPCGINFDSHAGTLPFAASIKVRAVDWQMYEGVTPMPPAAIVPDDELALLREWIDCGAPGPDEGVAAPKCPDP
ncbi:MAG: hypothetical protein JNK56_08930 [Myxococcales bacterium]|nr:hypothetical protein [Myxococcales bacterium]